jgi:hypothetical protein
MDVSTSKPNKDFCSDPSMAIYTMLSHHGILDLVVITNIFGIAKDRLNVIGRIGTFFKYGFGNIEYHSDPVGCLWLKLLRRRCRTPASPRSWR